MLRKLSLLSVFLLIINIALKAYPEDFIQVPAAIQITSVVSDGKHSIDEILSLARRNNIKVVITTDRDFMIWEYGLWPLRNIIRKIRYQSSISQYGIRRYLKEM